MDMKPLCSPLRRAAHPQRMMAQALTVPLVIALLAGCDVPPLTPTPSITPIILRASATVNPRLPTQASVESQPDVLDFTPAALPLAPGSNATITPTPVPTEASFQMSFTAPDGLTLASTYYGAAVRPAPTVLLLHMYGGTKAAWGTFAVSLQQTGYNVVALDLRGHGDTGSAQDWSKARQDIVSVLRRLSTLPGVQRERISVVGASIGANLALNACAEFGACRSVVLLSPAADYLGITAEDALARYGSRPMLIVATRKDSPSSDDSMRLNGLATGDRRLILNAGQAHGTHMLTSAPDLGPTIIQWLNTH
jgi:dienelactone hydrolase